MYQLGRWTPSSFYLGIRVGMELSLRLAWQAFV
jgi:hypothetical protein